MTCITDELTRSRTGIGQHQGADEHQLRQAMDKDSTKRLSHLSSSFQTCSQPEGHPWLTQALTDQPLSAMWPWPYDPQPCWEQLSMAVRSSRTPLKHTWFKYRVSCSPSAEVSLLLCTHQTSSTQPYTAQPPWCLWNNEDLPNACLCAKQGVRGKWPSLYPQANCWLSCTLGVWVTPSTLIAAKSCRDWGDIQSWQESQDIHLILNMLFITGD